MSSLRAALRGGVGCDHLRLANLSEAERAHCAKRLAAIHAASKEMADAGIDPEKRAAYALEQDPRNHPNLRAIAGCKATFGVGGFKWVRPARGVKLGPLPCNAAGSQLPAP